MPPRWVRRLVFGTPLRCGLRLHRADRGGGEEVRRHLDGAADALVGAYDMALDDDGAERLAARLAELPDLVRGFAYEGAGAALTVLDRFLPAPRSRFEALLRGPGAPFAVLLHVGAGLALSRVSRHIEEDVRGMDAEMRWLPVDAYGFERGVFASERVVSGGRIPPLSAYGRRAFDQGLGRGLWFRAATGLERIARTIAGLAPERHADIWSGVGLAAAYAGPNTEASLAALDEAAGPNGASVRLGVACAAFMRSEGRNPSPHTERAARALCHMPGERAADEARRIQAFLHAHGDETVQANPYEAFRVSLQAAVAGAAPRQEVLQRV
jgi:enediyne biosynthesis protein E3